MFNCSTTTTIRRLCFLALLCICLGAESATTTRCMERENQALLKLKNGFTDESGMLSSWVEEDDCCKWKGISCDNTTGHVTMFNLPGHNLPGHPEYETMRLAGTIHPSVCELQHLTYLDLSGNSIEGYVFAIGNEVVSPSFVDNAVLRWKGQDYEYGKNLALMTSIDLSHNLFTGEIPHSITSLASLASLNLSRNNFTGFIPDDFGHMKMLESLDLSENSISGTIPKSFQNLSFLAYMNISFNNLSGRIPSGTQLQSFDASAYVGNSGLCGRPLEKECQEYKDSQEKKLGGDDEDESINFGFYISVVLGFIVGFWGIYGSLIINSSWRHKYFQMIENMNDWILALVAV